MSLYHLFESVIGKLILAAFFVVMFMLIASSIIRTDVHARDIRINLDKISAAHIVEYCLKNGTEYIDVEFLENNQGTNVCDLCDICARMMEVSVTSTVNANEWKFNYGTFKKTMQWLQEKFTIWMSENHVVHSIFVSIKDGDKITTGRLDVKI